MALLRCPDCGRDISDIAVTCPACGRPNAAPQLTAGPVITLIRQPKIPGTVTAACVLWIVYGALGLVGGAVAASASTTAGIVQLGFGAVFLITGIQVLMGKASGLMLTGITCIVLGGLVLLFVLSTIARASDAYAAGYALGVMSGGVLLVTAGILALVGNGRYKQWIAQRPR